MTRLFDLEAALADAALGSATVAEELEALRRISSWFVPLVPDTLADLLQDQVQFDRVAARSYRHAAGFDKLILVQGPSNLYRASLHLWRPGTFSPGYDQEVLHDHNMPFVTHLLSGEYTQDLYTPMPAGERHTAFVFGRLEYEPRGSHTAPLRWMRTVTARTGDTYSMTPEDLHQIVNLQGLTLPTCSLFIQGKFYKDEVRLYVPGLAHDFPIVPRVAYSNREVHELVRLAAGLVGVEPTSSLLVKGSTAS